MIIAIRVAHGDRAQNRNSRKRGVSTNADEFPRYHRKFPRYHRKQGLIGKLSDALMSAPYIGAMARRKARIDGLIGDRQ